MTAMAWSIHQSEMLYLPLWILTIIACVLITFFGINYGLENQKKLGLGIKGITLLIPVVGILSYANKTYDKNVFSEFYDIEKTDYKAVFKPQP